MKVVMFKTKKGGTCICLSSYSQKTGRDEILTFDNVTIVKFVTYSVLAELEKEFYISSNGFASIDL